MEADEDTELGEGELALEGGFDCGLAELAGGGAVAVVVIAVVTVETAVVVTSGTVTLG